MALLAIVVATSSCLKDEGYDNQQYGTIRSGTPASALKSVRILEGGVDGGDVRRNLLAFKNTAAPLDTSKFTIAYFDNTTTVPAAPAKITITLGIDPSFIATYNASQNVQYERMPDSLFTIPTLTTTIEAGQQFSQPLIVIFKPNKFNSAKIYMLPIKILTATGVDGVTIQANYGTIVYSIIGNPLAGTYTVTALRYNYLGTVVFNGNPANIPPPVSTTAIPSPKLASAIDGDRVGMDFSNLGSQTSFNFQYVLTQLGNFSNISVGYNTEFTSGNSAIVSYLSQYISPLGQKARFRIITHYNNAAGGGGNDRIIDELFQQQ